MTDHDWPYGEPIVVVLEGGLVQGVYSPSGSPRPVVVIDYDNDEIDSDRATEVPQPDGGTTLAWVSDHYPHRLNPVITDFIHNYIMGE